MSYEENERRLQEILKNCSSASSCDSESEEEIDNVSQRSEESDSDTRGRAAHKGKLTQFTNFIDNLSTPLIVDGVINLELRIENIIATYDKFDSIQNELESLSEDTDSQILERAKFEEPYFESLARAKGLVKAFSNEHITPEAKPSHNAARSSAELSVAAAAAAAIEEQFYADELLLSGDDEHRIAQVALEVDRVLRTANFHLRRGVFELKNDEVLQILMGDNSDEEDDLQLDEEDQRILTQDDDQGISDIETEDTPAPLQESVSLPPEPTTSTAVLPVTGAHSNQEPLFKWNQRTYVPNTFCDVEYEFGKCQEVDADVLSPFDIFCSTTNFYILVQNIVQESIRLEEAMQEISSLKNENTKLRENQIKINSRLTITEKETRVNNLEFHCIPENRGKNLVNTLQQIGKTIGSYVENGYIVKCTRIAKWNKENNSSWTTVLAKFATPLLRDKFFANVINYNKTHPSDKLNSSHLGIAGQKMPVFVCEHLTPEAKALHAAARRFAKEKSYQFVWSRNGNIYLRKAP
ncbi:unnamed protein product [Parnassius apollo]|uniref:(apollo) hypothetical protein n=1 Tax=Parnassius apollo TaxID=110799 RepID=A0A8S3W1X7_PARAO|nr:unnamed protein product [Parnassius apollo]